MERLFEREKQLAKRKDVLDRCELAAKLVLKHGSLYSPNIHEREIYENWHDDFPPGLSTLYHNITSEQVKWYIRNHIEDNDPIWNGSFIAGFSRVGKVNWSLGDYPSLTWRGSPMLAEIIKDCPFAGKLKNDIHQQEGRNPYRWKHSPALYLPSEKDSMSYLAGLLATGRRHTYKKQVYALYRYDVAQDLKKLGVPFYSESNTGKRCLTSPFFPALFTIFMPKVCTEYWMDIDKPYHGIENSAITWLTHIDSSFVTAGLPFLPSRRTVFYKFKADKGLVRNLQRMRVTFNLVELDNRFKNCVEIWYNNIKEKNNEEVLTD